jgi:AcrR family transcriptional regulator
MAEPPRRAPRPRSRRRTYRHGNVRAEAIAAAYVILAESDGGALSLRRVAEALGVAHRSLYNHFGDREDLLNAVAREGFRRLAVALRPKRTAAAFIAAFVRFALAHPALYDVMTSRRHATLYRTPELQAAVHEVITEALRLLGRPEHTAMERRRAVMKAYILIHGGIMLHRAGILDVPGARGLVAELARMVESG